MKTEGYETRLLMFSGLISVLVVANSITWGINPGWAVSQTVRANAGGCPSPVTIGVSMAELEASLGDQGLQSSPGPDCLNTCTPIQWEWQIWCRMRSPETDCSGILPWNDNFSWKRARQYWQWPGDVIAVDCGSWQDDGCCNTSYDMPPCVEAPATVRCASSTE